jgi:hypothetical protein
VVQNHIPRIPQSLYSPDISLCKDFLFGNVKRLFCDVNAAGVDKLNEKVIAILEEISHGQL